MTIQKPISKCKPPEIHIRALASRFHDNWKRSYTATNGGTPRIKRTSDHAWIAKHGGRAEVDISSADFDSLPSDWQKENREAAQVVLALVEDAGMHRIPFDEAFIEKAASEVHDQWLYRMGNNAPEVQRAPYLQLPRQEKEKDRNQVCAAITLFQRGLGDNE